MAGPSHVMCHHAKTVPSVMAGPACDGSHQKWRQPSVMAGRSSDGRTGSNEDIRMDGFHYYSRCGQLKLYFLTSYLTSQD